MSKPFKWTLFAIFIVILYAASFGYYLASKSKTANNSQDNANIPLTLKSDDSVSYIKKKYTDTDLPASINFNQLVGLIHQKFPDFKMIESSDNKFSQFLDKGSSVNSSQFQNWLSVKVTHKDSAQGWGSVIVEINDTESYEAAKAKTFQVCKEIWTGIDDRVPSAIDRLAQRVVEYEQQGSQPSTDHIDSGYLISLDASNYNEGYPVSCMVAIYK